MSELRLSRVKIFFLLLVCICSLFGKMVYAGTISEEEPGINPYRAYHAGNGDGIVDTYSGSLKVHHTDISIPGNGGLDIQVERIYGLNSGSFGTGLGDSSWKLHFGRLFGGGEVANQFCNSPQIKDINDRPWLELPDGSIQQFAKAPAGEAYLYISKQRWIAQCAGLATGGLIIYSPNGTRYEMTAWEIRSGRSAWNVSKITDRNGNWLSFKYTPRSLSTPIYTYTPIYLEEITSSDGRKVSFAYENEPVPPSLKTGDIPKLLRTISANGRTWTYNYKKYYDGFNKYTNAKLESVILPDGKYWFYSYPPFTYSNITYSGYLGEIKSPLGAKTVYRYNFFFAGLNKNELKVSSKEIYSDTNLVGKWSYLYDMNGSVNPNNSGYDVTTINGPDGTSTYKFISTHNIKYITGDVWKTGLPLEIKKCKLSCLSNIGSNDNYVEYYEWSNQLISTDHASKSNYVYGGVSADNAVYAPILSKKTSNSPAGILTVNYMDYDFFGNPQTVVETGQASKTKKITYYNNVSKWIIGFADQEIIDNTWLIDRNFDSNGNMDFISRYGISEKRTYYPSGDVWTVTDASNNTTTYSNYYRGVAQRIDKPENIVFTKVVNATGTTQSETDGENYTTRYDYDLMDRIKNIVPPRGNATSIDWSTGVSKRDKILTRGGYEEKTIFDAFGQIAEIIKRDLNTGKIVRTVFRYTAIGQKEFESYPLDHQYSISGGGSGVSTEYDGLGNIVKITHADGKVKTFNYLTNNNVEVLNEEGKKYTYVYRSFGNPAEKELMGINAPVVDASVVIKRNTLGHIIDISQGAFSVKRWDYYPGQELVRNSYETSGNYSYEYYPTGLLWKKTLGSKIATHTYDLNSRLKTISYNDGYTPVSSFGYDKNDRLRSNINGSVTNYYDYDENGNLKLDSVVTDGIQLSIKYGFDSNDKLESIGYPDPDNQKVELYPDAFGRPTKVHPLASINGYYPNGVVKDLFYANNVFTLSLLDARQRPKISVISNTAGKTFLNTTFEYYGTNSLRSISDTQNSMFNRTFEYDDIDRLTGIYGPWGNNGAWTKGSITYNGRGNIQNQTYGSDSLRYSYGGIIGVLSNKPLQSVSGSKSYSFSYDEFGNVISNGKNTFKYDMAANLRCIDCSSTSATNFTYGAGNIRAKKNKNGINTYFVYASNGNLMAEYTPKNAELKQYAYIGNKQIAMRRLWRMNLDLDKDGAADAKEINQVPATNIATAENLTFYHTDPVGSPIAASSHPDGTMIWQEHYKPYGERQTRSPYAGASSNWFSGKPEDSESGLSYFGARYYDPVIGRFMSVDPVDPNPNNIHSLNRYAYANNNPYKYVDPDGRMPIDTFWDAGNVIYDIGKIGVGYMSGNQTFITDGAVDLASDGAALFVPYVPAGSTKFAKMAKSLEQVADDALAMGKSTGAAAELKLDGKTYTAISGESVPHNDQVTGVLMGTPSSQRKPWHGGCAEIACLDKALNDGTNVRGGDMRAVNIGNAYGAHSTQKPVCSSCQDVLNHFGVNH